MHLFYRFDMYVHAASSDDNKLYFLLYKSFDNNLPKISANL
jgi:hypothetical protein